MPSAEAIIPAPGQVLTPADVAGVEGPLLVALRYSTEEYQRWLDQEFLWVQEVTSGEFTLILYAPRTQALLDALDGEAVACGSSLKFCRIAEGDIDLYPRFGPTSEWDTAAGQTILEAAGGAVLDPQGRPFRYNQRDTLLNGDFIAFGDLGLRERLPA